MQKKKREYIDKGSSHSYLIITFNKHPTPTLIVKVNRKKWLAVIREFPFSYVPNIKLVDGIMLLATEPPNAILRFSCTDRREEKRK